MQKSKRELEELILKAKQAYYNTASPIMSDEAYDNLEDQLKALDPESPVLKIVGAPAPKERQLQKVAHRRAMGSQDKIHTESEFDKWANRGSGEFFASYKADGGSIAAYYENGRLVQVLTRGSGKAGEDITASAYYFRYLPPILSKPFNWAVRCEAVLTNKAWHELDPTQASNPRNIANGILGRLDTSQAEYITAIAFDVDGADVSTEHEKEELLKSEGFKTAPSVTGTLDAVKKFYEVTHNNRIANKLQYWIDGIVVRINDLTEQQKLGETNNRPKGQVAWKFAAQGETTTIENVLWEVGATGAITPVAEIKPVRIGGTTVSRVSLANIDLIQSLGVTIGASVEVVKAGEIIPQISKVISSNPKTPIVIPSKCPSCSARLEPKQNVDGTNTVTIYCTNDSCSARKIGKIRRWSDSREILGLGETVIQALLESGTISDVSDLYLLSPKQIKDIQLSGKTTLGEKRAATICSEIESKGKCMSLPEFLGSFGTRGLGVRRATLMIESNPELVNIEKWFDGSLLDPLFASKAGVPQAGKLIHSGLQEEEETIRKVLPHVTITSQIPKTAKTGFYICITGSLPSGKRKADYAKPLAQCGGELIDDVTKELDYLVVSDPTKETSKSKKAKKLNIQIISEEQLQKLLNTKHESK